MALPHLLKACRDDAARVGGRSDVNAGSAAAATAADTASLDGGAAAAGRVAGMTPIDRRRTVVNQRRFEQ